MKTITECKTCKSYKKGYCKVKDMKVSINATFLYNNCNKYKKSFRTKIVEIFKR